MGIIAWIVLGLVAGFIASKLVNKSGEGLVLDIVLGIVGGFILTRFFDAAGVTGLNIYSLFVAVVGAVVVLLLYHLIFRRRAF